MVVVLIVILVCAGMATAVILPTRARHRRVEAHVHSERAHQLAESGADWAIARLRRSPANLATLANYSDDVPGTGSFRLTVESGESNGTDDDGDGVIDETDEAQYMSVTSVGTSGQEERAVSVMLRRSAGVPEIPAPLVLNVTSPVVDVRGNALTVNGADHDVFGVAIPGAFAAPALSSPAPIGDLVSQISARQHDQFVGSGASPSVGQAPALDLVGMIADANSSASIALTGGTHANADLGDGLGPDVVYCDGDLHLSGNVGGTGILAVDGDLVITGSFTWTGLVLVRDTVRLSGGGNTKRIVGALVAGFDVESGTIGHDADTGVTLSGTVDVIYSRAAVAAGSTPMGSVRVLSWSTVPVPVPSP